MVKKEYNLAGKQLVVDGITILGNRKKQRSSILTQAITNGELARDNALTGEQVEALGGTVIIISEDLTETKGRVTTNENNISGLDGRVETAEGAITSQGTRLETAEGNISSQGLRLTDAEGNISSQGVRITDAEGNIVAQGLRITDAEGNITAQGLRLTDAEGNIVAQGLRLSTAEGDISAQGLRLTTAEGNISAQGLRLTDAEGNIVAQGLRITDAEGKLLNLQQVTKRFDVRSKQTTIIRDDTQKGSQEIVLQSTIIGYENPQPRLAIMTSFTIERICAMEADPSTLIDESGIGSSITPTPSGEGSWYRGGLLFQVGDSAAFIQYSGAVYQTVVLTVTAVGDSSITGTVAEIVPAARGIDDRDMTNVAIYIPYRYAGKIEATLYNGSTLMDSLTIPVTDQTRSWKQLSSVYDNKAELDAVKEDEEGYLVDGDCAVVRYEYNETTQQYDDFQLNTYILKAGTWTKAEDSDAKQIIETIYTYLGEASEYKKTHPDFNYEDTTSASRAIFGKLMAGIIYAGEIFANEILSARYEKAQGAEYPTRGFRLSTKEDVIEAVSAVFKSAKVKDSSLEDVTIKITDGMTNTELLRSMMGIKAPQTSPQFTNEAKAYYVESAIRNYFWPDNASSALSRYSGNIKREPSDPDNNATIEFDVKNKCYIYFRAPFSNFAKIYGEYGTMTSTLTVNGTQVWTETVQNCNVASGTWRTLERGDHVVFSVSYTFGTAKGIRGLEYESKVYILKYWDQYQNKWSEEGSESKGLSVDAYCIPTTMTITQTTRGGTTTVTTATMYFPVMAYQDLYVATTMYNRGILADRVDPRDVASLLQEDLPSPDSDYYKAITPLLQATGTQGGQTVPAIPRNVWIDIGGTLGDSVTYKRNTFRANQLYLADTYAMFAYNGGVLFTITDIERSTVAYSITLTDMDPYLTVGHLLPSVPGVTDIGMAGKEFDNVHAKTVHAGTAVKTKSISAPTGETLDIQADTISGTLTGNVNGDVDGNVTGDLTGDVTGNVNAQNTPYIVWGAVFN